MRSTVPVALFLGLATTFFHAASRDHTPPNLTQNTQELLRDSMQLGDALWDKKTSFLYHPFDHGEGRVGVYVVRESAWYALGLLLRDNSGDREKAVTILNAVLAQQYTQPGVRWYGTFHRSPEEPTPGSNPEIWKDYDPNWREFIGTTFALILLRFPDRIPFELAHRMNASIDTSIEGEMAEGRLVPAYSNIALMYGFLWSYAAKHNEHAAWQKPSAGWSNEVYRLFTTHNAFGEYNSPTYYGVDLYGLALWRNYGETENMRQQGAAMEAALWNDVADFYQPDLRNISGPYDRAYGMDMESYVGVLGVWMRTLLGQNRAPLPRITTSTDHVADSWFAPLIAVLGTRMPNSAIDSFLHFRGEHIVRKQITEDRTATAWIGKAVIYGGESTSLTRHTGSDSQFHPATIQWRTPSGEIGWVQLIESPSIDAIADKEGLRIVGHGNLRFHIHAKSMDAKNIYPKIWDLPGLKVTIETDAGGFSKETNEDGLDITYIGMNRIHLKPTPDSR